MSEIVIFLTAQPGEAAKRLLAQAEVVAGFDGSHSGEDEVGVTLRLLTPKLTTKSILKAIEGVASSVRIAAVSADGFSGSQCYLGNAADAESVLRWLIDVKKQRPRGIPSRVGDWYVMRCNDRVFLCQYVRKAVGEIGALFDFYETTGLGEGQLPQPSQRLYRKQGFVVTIAISPDWQPLGKRTPVDDPSCPKFLDSLKHAFRFPIEEVDDWHLVDDGGRMPISAADRPWERYEFHGYFCAAGIRELLLTGEYQPKISTSREEDLRNYEILRRLMDKCAPGGEFEVALRMGSWGQRGAEE
jgi:hypothetical protein